MTNDEKILAGIGALTSELAAMKQETQKAIAGLTAEVEGMRKEFGGRLDGMEGRMESMEQEQKAMRQDISSLREDVSVMKEDVADLKAMQEEIWKDIARHDEKIAAVKEETDRLKLA